MTAPQKTTRQRAQAGRRRARNVSLLPAANQPQNRPPQPQDQPQLREHDGWRVLSYLLGGMLIYGGLGWLIGHWTGISVLFPLGMILGLGLGIATIVFRYTKS
jgi:ATP synthase protein I